MASRRSLERPAELTSRAALPSSAAPPSAEAAAERERAARSGASSDLFARAVGAVQPLRAAPPRAAARREPPAPIAVQRELRRAARAARSDLRRVRRRRRCSTPTTRCAFAAAASAPTSRASCARGDWAIQARDRPARPAPRRGARARWPPSCARRARSGLRCVRVVHGKGLGSPGKQPVLKGKVQRWLVQKNEVLAFVQARAREGGAGALVVLLAPRGASAESPALRRRGCASSRRSGRTTRAGARAAPRVDAASRPSPGPCRPATGRAP